MKILHTLPVFLLLAVATFGQIAKPTPERTSSKVEQFSDRSGTLFEKSFEKVGLAAKGTDVEIYTITDLLTGSAVQGVRVETYVSSSLGGDTKIGVLDADELDGLIKSIDLLAERTFKSTPGNYTEVVFRSRGGFEAGAYYANDKWKAFLKLERYDSRSQIFIDASDLVDFGTILKLAKAKLKVVTK